MPSEYLPSRDPPDKPTLLQLKSNMLAEWPPYSCTVFGLKTGAFNRTRSPSLPATSSSFSCARRSSDVDMTAQTLTAKSCPPAARYLPSLENSMAQTAPPSFLVFPGLKPFLTPATCLPPACAISTPVFPLSSCARKTRLKALSFLPCERTLIYLGGAGKRGMNPIGCEKTSASIPSVLLSPISTSSSFISAGTSFFLDPMKRLRNETPFLN